MGRLTFEELLACVFLEEGFMCDRTCQVVDHELEDGLDLFLIITSIVSQCRVLIKLVMLRYQRKCGKAYPVTSVKDLSCQVHSGSSCVTWEIMHEAVIKQADLHEILP
jgi:hypothetical protein